MAALSDEKQDDFKGGKIEGKRNGDDNRLKVQQMMKAPRFSAWQGFTGDSKNSGLTLAPTGHRIFAASNIKDSGGINKLKDWVQRDEKLLVKGQGCVELYLKRPQPFGIALFDSNSKDTIESIVLSVSTTEAKIEFVSITRSTGGVDTVTLIESKEENARLRDKGGSYTYWISIDDYNKRIRYGAGELRLKNLCMGWCLNDIDSTKESELHGKLAKLIENADSAALLLYTGNEAAAESDYLFRVWRDAVIIEPAIKVVSRDVVRMEDIDNNSVTVIDNLPIACQMLYWNVCGKEIVLNDKSFPQFSDAIEESINDKNGWCYKTLANKVGELGDDPTGTYLRITLGVPTGNSPGCPFVMEIWPPGHHSPIHNHADAYAIIRVLHGEIKVSLFPHLSPYYQREMAHEYFHENDVTYILPGLNQTHQLKNESLKTTCVTIQCYQYGESNSEHYEFFDWVNPDPKKDDINQFDPNSDCRFSEFKGIMKKEYEARHSK